jgi:hypothetical protein
VLSGNGWKGLSEKLCPCGLQLAGFAALQFVLIHRGAGTKQWRTMSEVRFTARAAAAE